MSFLPYRPSPFETSHENIFFRELTGLLERRFAAEPGLAVLVGNVSCGGHQLDAIFIRDGQISVLEFKKYSGALHFSENNPWRIISPEGEPVWVSGGGSIRNPFQQVKAYRNTLCDYLENARERIFGAARTDLNLRHVGGIVVFDGAVEIENRDQLPTRAAFFRITDRAAITGRLADLVSKGLHLTDNDIRAILRELGIDAASTYTPEPDPPQESPGPRNNKAGAQLRYLDKLLGQSSQPPRSIHEKHLRFYELALRLESYKEARLKEQVRLSATQDPSKDTLQIQQAANPRLMKLISENRKTNFPKDVIIGLSLEVLGQQHLILSFIVPQEDLRSPDQAIQLPGAGFELYRATFDSFGMAEELINDFEQEVSQAPTLAEKVAVVVGILGLEEAPPEPLVSAGLVDSSSANLQAIQELRELAKEEPQADGFFERILVKGSVPAATQGGSEPTVLEVTALDHHQRAALVSSLSSPLTVITGPPGTGKSQVVLNILANSVARGERVLFASKMNKAVDTVRERFAGLFDIAYMLRYGSKSDMREKYIPGIEQLLTARRQARDASGESRHEVPEEVESIAGAIRGIEAQLALLDTLPGRIAQVAAQWERLSSSHETWYGSLNRHLQATIGDRGFPGTLPKVLLQELLFELSRATGGWWRRLFYAWFKRKWCLRTLAAIETALPQPVQRWMDEDLPQDPSSPADLPFLRSRASFLAALPHRIEEARSGIESFEAEEAFLRSRHDSLSEQLEQLRKNAAGLRSELECRREAYRRQCIRFVQKEILYRQANLDSATARSYLDDLKADRLPRRGTPGYALFESNARGFLGDLNVLSGTSLSIRNAVPLARNLFDVVVIDEASQNDFASALPLIYRAKRVVVIGDPMQLAHVTHIQDFQEEYLRASLGFAEKRISHIRDSLFQVLFEVANASKLDSYFLAGHYRCHPAIIGFSAEYFYRQKMGQEIEVHTSTGQFRHGTPGFSWVHVNGETDPTRNQNQAESQTCIAWSKRLAEAHPDASIGITTPFRHQAEWIRRHLPESLADRVTADTVHRYQGDEKDIMIVSLVVTPEARGSLSGFINRSAPYLLNVAVTRARSSLVIVGDLEFCLASRDRDGRRSLLGKLAAWAKEHGNVTA